jgi:hypothetical protein
LPALLLSPLLLPQPPMRPLPCSQLLAAQGLAPGVQLAVAHSMRPWTASIHLL